MNKIRFSNIFIEKRIFIPEKPCSVRVLQFYIFGAYFKTSEIQKYYFYCMMPSDHEFSKNLWHLKCCDVTRRRGLHIVRDDFLF